MHIRVISYKSNIKNDLKIYTKTMKENKSFVENKMICFIANKKLSIKNSKISDSMKVE